MAEVRECAQCGTPFTPRREHARFCSPRCRMAWNREHVGVAAAPPVAIDWSVTAMTEAAGRLAEARISDRPRMAAAVAEAVWWVTLVDATLVRYHPRGYETALADKAVRRRKTEETLEGLRYVRNQLGKSVDPAAFIRPANDEGTAAWAWRRQPEPGLGDLSARARRWELGRYRAYQERLAGHDIARTFTRCTEFLARAASLAGENDTPDGVGVGASQNLDRLVPVGRGQRPASRREVRADPCDAGVADRGRGDDADRLDLPVSAPGVGKVTVPSSTSNYAKQMKQIVTAADAYLAQAARHYHGKGKPALVFDIDDTLLNTYDYTLAQQFGFDPATNLV